MKYTLQENAMSSFHLAIENFKKFFYMSKSYKPSELDEARKLCAIFLENSIELFLKALLSKNDGTSIYIDPENGIIKKAKEEADKRNVGLEDILVEKGNFKTITYRKAIEIFNNLYPSERTQNVFIEIGEYRNRLTHFGITTDDDDEFTIACINVFIVIYQNLFEKLITLEKIGHYFIDDDIFVRTIHGWKMLLNENGGYNNIIDFLDELVEIAPSICLEYRLKNDDNNIQKWCSLLDKAIKSNRFQKMLDYYEASINWENSNLYGNDISFEISDASGVWDCINSSYSPYYNATIFLGGSGAIYFRVLHSTNEIVIYNEDITQPEIEMPQYEEDDWNEHISCGDAKKYSLTQRNINLAFETICKEMKENRYEVRNNNTSILKDDETRSEYETMIKNLSESFFNTNDNNEE